MQRESRIIRESGLFDEAFYVTQSPELKGRKGSMIADYLRRGVSRGRNPSRSFDTGFYLDANPDVARRKINPLIHYIRSGRSQGRKTVAASEDWEALDVPTLTTTAAVDGGSRIYVVPAYLSERNTTRYRAYNLVELLAGADVTVVDYHRPPERFFSQLEQGAIVILQRLALTSATEAFLQRLKQSPALIVYDIDDQVFDANELDDWRLEALAELPSRYARCMAYADHFLVSTTRLRDKVERRFRKPAHVVTNCLGADVAKRSDLAFESVAAGSRPFVVGYASGSATHEHDLAAVLPALERFLGDNPEAEFHCIGHLELPETFRAAFGDRIVQRPAVHWKDLPAELARFTVQIIPLEDCTFNAYKSHIRFLESAAVGVPVIVSTVSELARTVIDGETGLVRRNDADDWCAALQTLHDDPLLRSRIGEKARRFVTRYFTTASPFMRARARRALDDLALGACRDKLSIVVVTYNPPGDVRATLDAVLATVGVPFELLVWNNSADPETRAYLGSLDGDNILVVDAGQNAGKARAANYLFGIAAERFICGFDDDYTPPPQWDLRMIHAAKAIPNLGWLSTNLTADSSGIRDRGEVDAFPGGVSVLRPAGVGGWVMFTTASSRQKIGLYREHGLYGGIDGDYNRRARRLGLYTGYVRGVVGTHKHGRMKNAAWELFKQRIQDDMRIHGKDSDNVADKFVDFFGARPAELCVAVKICTSVTHDENVWGDTHFAYGLRAALEKHGYLVRVDKHETWYEANAETTDIVIHLFGLHKYRPDERHLNILWIISHADLIDADFLYGFDYVFAASDAIAERARALAPEVKVETLPQCTDTTVFFPDPATARDLEVVFVGNSRRIYREAVKFAVEEGFDVSVWGTRWEPFIDRKFIKGQSLNGQEVADVYRRAKVVLNDHWADQKSDGLVNNRIFDVLASGTMVLSDDNPGLPSLFGNRLPTFSDRASFAAGLRALLADPGRDEAAAAMGEEVRAAHTFGHRANVIHDAVNYLIHDYVAYKSELLWTVRRRREERGTGAGIPETAGATKTEPAAASSARRRRRNQRARGVERAGENRR
ncbi:MAG: glycosyltransferase [Bauldia sp.]|nr:glycosyltransferase [Bauldia sp.]